VAIAASADKPSRGDEAAREKTGLDPLAEAFLRHCLREERKFDHLMVKFEHVGCRSFETAKQIVSRLVGEGWIETVEIPIRGNPKLSIPTQKAFGKFEVRWKNAGRGSIRTQYAQHRICERIREKGWWARKEFTLKLENGEEKQCDVVWRDDQGNLAVAEVEGESAGHGAHNALFLVKHQEVKKIYVVGMNKKICDGVVEKFKPHPELKDARIKIVTLGTFLGKNFAL
jgi:hypothetical protein